MMPIRMGAGALNQTPLDWDGNQGRIVALLRRAREAGVTLLCLPELCLSGYGCEDAFLGGGCLRQAERLLGELLPETRGLVVSLGLPVLVGHGVYDAAAVVVDGRLVGVAAKRFLAGDGVHYEPRWFKPWPEGKVVSTTLAGETVPIGDLVFEVGAVRLGFEICEDAWVASRPGAALARASVDVILNPSASHFAFGKLEVRRRFVLEGTRAFGAAYLYANLLGNEAGRVIYDGGPLVAAGGGLLGQGRRFSFADDDLVHAVVDVEQARMAQARVASFQPDPTAAGDRLVRAPFAWPRAEAALDPAASVDGFGKDQEFLRAEALALFDYLRKSRAQGFVLSLSGGVDSTAVAVLVAASVRLAAAELGLAAVKGRLGHVRGIDGCSDERAVVGRLLTTAYQATAQSGPVTRQAARAVAEAIGARHHELDVEPILRAYRELGEAALGRPLDWQTDDLALQNLQARGRGPGIWLLANVEDKLLLTTSNRSEAAVGYATMDGDTCGGLAPLAGIDKAYLRRWLVWLERGGAAELGPLPALAAVNGQRSTPELRPPAEGQLSEEDLMPFPVLDRIERLAIRDKLTPAEVLATLAARSPELDVRQLARWVERFFLLFARNQWKRERYAPSFHLDDENLDPKTWCRFPILSGGYRHELRELEETAAALLAAPSRGGGRSSG
jgi:NAD+ synthase (glutamine-hydrolysing)